MSVYDTKAKAFLLPFYVSTIQVGLRHLEQAVRDPNHPFGQFPEDYVIFLLGDFDDDLGAFIILKTSENLGPLALLQKLRASHIGTEQPTKG